MTTFPLKFKLSQQTTDRRESGNTYKLIFKYDEPKESYYSSDSLKATLTFSATEKGKIDAIKESLHILNIGEIFFLGISKDPQKRLDEYLFPEKVEEVTETDPFETFVSMVKDMSGNELAPRFHEISEEIKKIDAKSRKSKDDKERLEFLKKCHAHLEENFFIPPTTPYYSEEETTDEEETDSETNDEEWDSSEEE